MENRKKIYRVVMLIFIVALITFMLTSVFIYNKLERNTFSYGISSIIDSKVLSKIYAIKQIINENYLLEYDNENLENGIIKGYVNGIGDEYTEYFTADEMKSFITDTEGNYEGIGIYMVNYIKDNSIVVIQPIEGSPAEKVGILPGDVIKKVDGIEYLGEQIDEMSSYIKNKKEKEIKLEIERNGQIIEVVVEKCNVKIHPIKYKTLENNIGYIKITAFDEECSSQFKNAYEELEKNNIESLIIDLRDNGGGLLSETLQVANYILDKKSTVLITIDKEGKECVETTNQNPIVDVPIVILTNENTASASEVLTAALKENNKAVVVGEKTYGKGVIQELISFSDGSGMKITTEEYLTPNRNRINKIGITPDKEVKLDEGETLYTITEEEDNLLNEAVQILQSK